MDELDKTSKYLAQNISNLRKKKNFSQLRLAKIADIPRSTLTNIESGTANPSLSNLVKISYALGVGVEELLSRPRSECTLIPSKDIKTISQNSGNIIIKKLLPDKIKGIEIDQVEFSSHAIMVGHPHLVGTKEYLTVLKGELIVYLSGDSYKVQKGDVFAFPANQSHSYKNPKKTSAIAISVVIPVPSSI